MKLKYTLFMLSLFCLLSFGQLTIAQNDLQDQINQIDDSVDRIIISSNGEEYIFEGDDAEKLFKKMKSSKSQSFVWNSSDDSSKKKIIVLNTDGKEEVIEVESGGDDIFMIKTDKDFDSISNGIQKKVIVEVADGNKKVTVTTKENGEKTIEVYEGHEAEEYIEKMKAENKDFNISIDENKDGKKVKKIIIETDKGVE